MNFVLHFREGILPPPGPAAPGLTVLPYSAELPFEQLAAQVRGTGADVHLFGDLVPPPLSLQLMARVLSRHGMRAAATPATPSLERLGYADAAAAQAGAVGAQIRPCRFLPGWCAAVPEALLEEAGFFAGDEETLDFRLLRVSRALAALGVPMVSIGTPLRELDERLWARNLLLALQGGLARDFAGQAGAEDVPHQLRVRQIGGELDVPPPPPASEGPKFSLLCPAYKPEFVEEMLASVLGQAYTNWELLMLVDGPPEASHAAFEALFAQHAGEHRLKPSFQANAGTGVTRQRLFERATGEYVIFIDDDDCLAEDCLGIFAACLDADPALDVIRAGAQIFGVVNRYLPPLQRLTVDGVSGSLFEVTQPFAVRRELITSFGGLHGDPGFGGVGEDSDLFMRLDRAGAKTRLIDRPLYRRRLSTLNQSLNFGGDTFTDHVHTLIRRHAPPGWSLDALTFNMEAGFVKQVATYKSVKGAGVLHCPSRYFNYNTLGESE